MLKRMISVILAVLMVASLLVFAASAENTDDAAAKDTKIYFDTTTTGWSNFSKIGFYVWEVGGSEIISWGSKSLNGKNEGDGIWSYDVISKMNLQDGVQYCIIFTTDTGLQTYNLLFDTTCLGDTAYCDTSIVYENPEDSSKTAIPAFWRNHDASQYGPELKISSIGTVVGTCVAANTSRYLIFVDFLKNTLDNARTFSGQSDQEIIDTILEGLHLKDYQVQDAIAESGVEVDWQPTEKPATQDEPQPTEPAPTEPTPTEPAPTEPAPTEPVPTEPAPTEPTPTEIPNPNKDYGRGDVDGDDQVTVLDATMIQLHLLGKVPADVTVSEDQLDVDKDGIVCIFDANRIQRYAAHMCNLDGSKPYIG